MINFIRQEVEFARQKSDLFLATDIAGSGQARYSAAMYFYNLGFISADLLEIYRRCCKFDHEDPMALARLEKVPTLSAEDIKLKDAAGP